VFLKLDKDCPTVDFIKLQLMKFEPENLYHIYNQGNNKQNIFDSKEDYIIFMNEIRALLLPHCEIVAYCLMPNHFHLMVYTDTRNLEQVKQGVVMIDPLSNGIRKLLSGYARIYNKKYERSGSLFRQKTKSKLLTTGTVVTGSPLELTDYTEICFHYIHQNPFKAGLVNKLENWEYSSFKDYAGLRNGTLCNKELAKKFCYYDPSDFVQVSYRTIF